VELINSTLLEYIEQEKNLIEMLVLIIKGERVSFERLMQFENNEKLFRYLGIKNKKLVTLGLYEEDYKTLETFKRSPWGMIISRSNGTRLAFRYFFLSLMNTHFPQIVNNTRKIPPSFLKIEGTKEGEAINTTFSLTPLILGALKKLRDYHLIESVSQFTRDIISWFLEREKIFQKNLISLLGENNKPEGTAIGGLTAKIKGDINYTVTEILSSRFKVVTSFSEAVRIALHSFFRKQVSLLNKEAPIRILQTVREVEKKEINPIIEQPQSSNIVRIPISNDEKGYKEYKIIGRGSISEGNK